MTELTKDEIKAVYIKLRDREKHPRGKFDSAGRFFLADRDLTACRSPSRQYKFSEMHEGRTLKYVKKLVNKYQPKTVKDLESVAFA